MGCFGILVAGDLSDNPDQLVQKKGKFQDMFLRLLRDEGEEWKLFFVYDGDFPTEEELQTFDGFVITGSVGDAFGQEDWLVKLRGLVRRVADSQTRLLGVCFGHQVVGTAYDAKVGRAGFFECGAREVTVHPAARASVGASWAELLPDRLVINEVHQDQVLEVPKGATILASSERCPIEAFCIGSNVLCLQGHPEFDEEVVVMLTERHREDIAVEDLELRDASFKQLRPAEYSAQLQQLCKTFLKG
ncbi:hypothetical protein N2152v2_006077 [Parachlorella kessleri]